MIRRHSPKHVLKYRLAQPRTCPKISVSRPRTCPEISVGTAHNVSGYGRPMQECVQQLTVERKRQDGHRCVECICVMYVNYTCCLVIYFTHAVRKGQESQ